VTSATPRLRLTAATLTFTAALLGLPCAGGCRRAVVPPVAAPAASADPAGLAGLALAEGDRAWSERADPAALQAALVAFRRAAALLPGDPAAELRLARAEALRAQLAATPAEARQGWDAASRAGERALRARAPEFTAAIGRGDDAAGAAATVPAAGAEPLYWLAVGRLRVAQATGPMAVMVTKDVVLGLLERVVELDERLDRAGPHRWLGALRAALPAAAGGGVARAIEHFERAKSLAPEDPFRPVLEAETLAVLLQDGARFDALLAEVAARDPAAERPLAAEITAARRMAGALAARRAQLF
jgi:hypothetical protein